MSGPPEKFAPTEASYAKTFDIKPEEVGYIGVQGMEIPTTGQKLLIAFTERKTPGRPFVSSLIAAPDTRDVDRKIAERYFARELQNGVSSHESLWVLFDNAGHPLKPGTAAAGTLKSRRKALKSPEAG